MLDWLVWCRGFDRDSRRLREQLQLVAGGYGGDRISGIYEQGGFDQR